MITTSINKTIQTTLTCGEVAAAKVPVVVFVVRTRTIQSCSEPSPTPVYFELLRNFA
jgi:hypothetical protein